MAEEANGPEFRVRIGCHHDTHALIELARDRLPTMTSLHDPASWDRSYRFGPGYHSRDRYLPVVHAVRDDGSEALVAFAWVDAALADDLGVEQPWWCINALAVRKEYARRGIGSGVVSAIVDHALGAGVVSVYGQAYASAAEFWRSCGFWLTALGGLLASQVPVPVPGGAIQQVVLNAEEDQHFFVKSIEGPGSTTADSTARLASSRSPNSSVTTTGTTPPRLSSRRQLQGSTQPGSRHAQEVPVPGWDCCRIEYFSIWLILRRSGRDRT